MADARYFCPECGCIDLVEPESTPILNPEGSSATTHTCPNCGWEGTEAETHGVYTSEKMWGIEEYAEVMLRILAIHATAPLIQLFEFQGLIPRESEAETSSDIEASHKIKDHIMRSVFVAVAEAAFTAALDARRELETSSKGVS